MFAGYGSARIAANSCSAQALATASKSFQPTMIVLAVAWAGTPGLDGMPCVGQARPGLGQQAVEVAVVGAGELQELLAPGGRAGQADRAHARLGPARRHPQHLHRRDAAGDLLGQVDLAGRRRAERGAVGRRGLDGLDDRRVAWPWMSGPTT
jgi:hypothetical protein